MRDKQINMKKKNSLRYIRTISKKYSQLLFTRRHFSTYSTLQSIHLPFESNKPAIDPFLYEKSILPFSKEHAVIPHFAHLCDQK